MAAEHRIDLVGGDAALAAVCGRALVGIAEVVRADVPRPVLPRDEPADLVMLAIDGRSVRDARRFADLKRTRPEDRVMLLASNVDANLAVELVHCGAEDLLALPVDPDVLRRKVLRAFGRREGPALDAPVLSPFDPRPGASAGAANLRHCFRATVPMSLQARAVVPVGTGQAVLAVCDISVEVGEWPGGLLLEASPDVARAVPLRAWAGGAPVALTLHIGADPRPIPVVAHVRGGPRTGPRDGLRIGVQVQARVPADRRRLQHFWMQCQRPLRRSGRGR